MPRGRTWTPRSLFAFVSILCVVVTVTMCFAGESLVTGLFPRFWILGLSGLGSIVGTHLYWAARGASKDAVRSSLVYLGVLSFATSVAWFLICLAASFPLALMSMSSRPSPVANEIVSIIYGTALLPLQISGWLQPLALPEPFKVTSILIYGFVITTTGLFGLSIITTGLYSKRKM